MMKPISVVIVGAGRHGLEVDSYLHTPPNRAACRLLGYIDDNKPVDSAWGSSKILGGMDALRELARRDPSQTIQYITATGHNAARREMALRVIGLQCPNLKALTVWHPSSSVGRNVAIGEGTCLAPGSIVTTNVTIGRHVILNVKASVSHDCEIGDYVNLNPGVTICGNVTIGEGAYIGAGATVINGITIGAWTVIGAGAAVVRNIASQVTAVGVPARAIKDHATKG